MRLLAAVVLALLAAPAAAQESADEPWTESYDPRAFTCPLGGERFSQDVGYSSYPLETLPDGSWLGDIAIDAQIPRCPGNGLVILPDYRAMGAQGMVYHDYSAAEMEALPALVADPEYVALAADGRHAQAYWLATRLGRPAVDRYALLQRATWAALAPELRRRLVGQFVAEGAALIAASEMPGEWKRLQTGYLVNGLRELARFDEALALLGRLEADGEAVPAAVDPGDMFSAGLAPAMRLAIAQRDDGRFPIELLDRRLAGLICDGDAAPPYNQRTPANIAACTARRDREARDAEEEEAALEESFALRQDIPALERKCGETAPDSRSAGLAMACGNLEYERDEAAAEPMLEDGPALAAQCEATPQNARAGPLSHACSRYELALESALGGLLSRDEQAWTIVCPENGLAEPRDRRVVVSMACGSAASIREGLGEEYAEDSSLGRAVREQAVALIAQAKADRTYPKRRPGDRD